MKLKPGCEAEYQKRHNEIWPELVKMLKDSGVYDYSIFWDKGDEYSVCRAENRRRANLAGSGTDPDRAEMVGLYGRYHGDQSG